MVISEQDKQAFSITPQMIIAIVAKDDLSYGLARMWPAHTSGPSFEPRAFRYREEAEKWIKTKLSKN